MDMEQLMAQAKQLQENVAVAQEKLSGMTVRGIAGNGDVIVTMTGKYDVTDLVISDALAGHAVRDAVLAALRDAKAKADAVIDQVMGDATAGMPLPE